MLHLFPQMANTGRQRLSERVPCLRSSAVSPGSQAHLAVRQHRGEKPLQWAYLGKGRALFSGAAASKLPLVGVKT